MKTTLELKAAGSEVSKFGCLMAIIPEGIGGELVDWAKKWIPESTLADHGIEDEPHVTVLYGFKPEFDVAKSELPELLVKFGPVDIKLSGISRFECPDYDVIKVDVESRRLVVLNAIIAKQFKKNIKPSEYDYHPHLTLAYVKKGTNNSLDGIPVSDHSIFKKTVTVKSLLYSLPKKQGRQVLDMFVTNRTTAAGPKTWTGWALEAVRRDLASLEAGGLATGVPDFNWQLKVDEVVKKMLNQYTADGRHYGQAQARIELRQYLKDTGYKPTPGTAGTMQDLSSEQRLNIILEMSTKLERGERQYDSGMTTAAMAVWPAWEFVRVEQRKEPRDWPTRWDEAGGQFFAGTGSGRAMPYPEAGRMIALKDSSIWTDISAFGLPYPPFDFNSGMGLAPVERAVCVNLGLVQRGSLPLNRAIQDLNIKVRMPG